MNKIQKITLLMAVVIGTVFSANAGGFRFGVKAGLNVNSFKFNKESIVDSHNRCGWTAGVMTEFVVPIIGVGFDVSAMYTRMNAEARELPGLAQAVEDVVHGNSIFSNELGKNFIEIPVNVKYKLSLPAVSSIIQPYIYTGPSFAFKLGKNTFNDFKTKTCQVAWNVGLGLELVRHLQLQASYGFGINNIADYTGYVHTVNDVKGKNNYWTITAGYIF